MALFAGVARERGVLFEINTFRRGGFGGGLIRGRATYYLGAAASMLLGGLARTRRFSVKARRRELFSTHYSQVSVA